MGALWIETTANHHQQPVKIESNKTHIYAAKIAAERTVRRATKYASKIAHFDGKRRLLSEAYLGDFQRYSVLFS